MQNASYTVIHTHLNRHSLEKPFLFWSIGMMFLLFQFFIQLSSGVVITAIMQEFSLSAVTAGILSSTYYYTYTVAQIPVGMLFDRQKTKQLMAINAFICSMACLCFSVSSHIATLWFARLSVGAASAFAFIGVTTLLRQYFKPQQFGIMIGLSETLAFLGTVLFMLILGSGFQALDWRSLMRYAAYVAGCIAILCAIGLPNGRAAPSMQHRAIWQDLKWLCYHQTAWINGWMIGLGFTLITVFGAMWALPFIQLKINCSIQMATLIDAMLFLGTGFSCPLFGALDHVLPYRRTLLVCSYLGTLVFLLLVLFMPIQSPMWLGVLFGCMGLSSGAYMLGFSIANEIAPSELQSTSTGFANSLAMLTAPLLQPIVGYGLDRLNHTGYNTLTDYQLTLLIVPFCLLLGGVLAMFLPEKPTSKSS